MRHKRLAVPSGRISRSLLIKAKPVAFPQSIKTMTGALELIRLERDVLLVFERNKNNQR